MLQEIFKWILSMTVLAGNLEFTTNVYQALSLDAVASGPAAKEEDPRRARGVSCECVLALLTLDEERSGSASGCWPEHAQGSASLRAGAARQVRRHLLVAEYVVLLHGRLEVD